MSKLNGRRASKSFNPLILAATMAVGATLASAQVTTWIPGSGNWSDPLRWTNGVPNAGTFTALVDNGNATNSVATVNGGFTVGTLAISSGDEVSVASGQTFVIGSQATIAGTLSVQNSAQLNASGTFNNTGSLTVGSAATFRVAGATTLGGAGTTRFNAAAGADSTLNGPGTLTIAAGHTVRGDGYFNNVSVINNGSMIGDDSVARLGGMYLDPFNGAADTFVNNGTIGAAAGNTVSLVGDFGGNFTGNGVYRADGVNGFLHLAGGVVVNGGSYTTDANGVVRVPVGNTANVTSPTITAGSNFRVESNSRLNVSGIINIGSGATLSINAGTNSSVLGLSGATTLQGPGTTIFRSTATQDATADSQGTLTIAAGHTVRGDGYFNNVSVINNGSMIGDDSVARLGGMYLDPFNGAADTFVNNGTIGAAAGNTVSLVGDFGGNFTGNGVYRADGVNGFLHLAGGVVVNGGSYTTDANGVVRVPVGNTANVTSPTITAGSNFRVESNSRLNVSGIINIGSGATLSINAGTNSSVLGLSGATTLQGPGTTIFRSTATQDATADSQGTLTIAAGHTVRGDGYFNNVNVINNGSMIGDDSVARLGGMYLDPFNGTTDAFVNNGTIAVTAGNFVSLVGDNGGNFTGNGVYRADGVNGFLHLASGVVINGGSYTTDANGVVRVPAGNTANITSPTITTGSNFRVENNSRLNILGTVTNNGSLTIGAGTNNSFLSVSGGGSATLTGTGITRFAGNPGVTNATLDGQATLTIAAGHVVAGNGYFNNTVVINNGSIRGDTAGVSSFYLDPYNGGMQPAILNNGIIAAVNNGSLAATAGAVTLAGDAGGSFGGPGFYRADGVGTSVKLINDVSIVGGNFATSSGSFATGSGEIQVPVNQVGNLNGSTITSGSNFNVLTGGRLRIANTITNNGTLAIVTTGANVSALSVTGAATLTGSGVTRFTGNPAVQNAKVDGQGTLTIAAGHIVAGAGYFDNTVVVNNGTIRADQVGTISFYLDPYNGFANAIVNNGTFLATGGATLSLAGDNGGNFSGSGPLIVDANSTITAINGLGGDIGPVSGAGTYRATSSANLGHRNFRVATLEATSSGTARITAGGGTLGTSKVNTLTINTGGRFDITDHDVAIDYTGASPITSIRQQIQSAYNNGPFNGGGITSSLAQAAAGGADKTGVAYGEATAVLGASPTTYSGVSIDATSIVLRYTLLGDANFDKTVNINDFAKLAGGFGTTGVWTTGDFNYDGNVNINDFALLAANFGKAVPADLPRGSAVPEPAAGGVVALLAARLGGRRRLRSR